MLLCYLEEKIKTAFTAAGFTISSVAVERSRRPELSQFQSNGPMTIAKILKRSPRDIAEAVARQIVQNSPIDTVTVDGPGFINISVKDEFLLEMLNELARDERGGHKRVSNKAIETIVMDFGGPNVAKAMHVGHLRSAVIGDTLCRLARFVGHDVISDVHLGDWGLPMGMVISELSRRSNSMIDGKAILAALDTLSVDMLNEAYPAAATRCRESTTAMSEARRLTARLQNGESDLHTIWSKIVEVSVNAARNEFARLNVTFNHWYGESRVHRRLEQLIAKLPQTGMAERSDGALVIRLDRPDDMKKIPPLMLEKYDGGVMYGGTDLATIQDRVEEFRPDRILYVVDQRQHLHFEQVFRASEKIGLVENRKPKLEHIGFGTVNGPDGKPFKTRAGGVLQLGDLIDQATDLARERLRHLANETLGTDELELAAKQLGVAAVRFADLSNNRTSDYIFNLERFSAAVGRTGPYLCYAVVRAESLIRKSGCEDRAIVAAGRLQLQIERDLLIQLLTLPDAIQASFEKRMPNILAEHLFDAAQLFNAFYQKVPILIEKDSRRKNTLLALTVQTARQLRLGLDLLGIEPPERM